MFRALVAVGPQGMTPGVMAEHLQVSPAALSFHLKELMNAGLVNHARSGRHLIYRASFDRIEALLGYLTDRCCLGQGSRSLQVTMKRRFESRDPCFETLKQRWIAGTRRVFHDLPPLEW